MAGRTRVLAVVWVVIFALVAAGSVASWLYSRDRKPPPVESLPQPHGEQNLDLTLTAVRPVTRMGKPIPLRVSFRNGGSEQVQLPPFLPWGLLGIWETKKIPSDGAESRTIIHFMPDPKVVHRGSPRNEERYGDIFEIPPWGEYLLDFDLRSVYRDLPPGSYRICIEYTGEITSSKFKVHLISNEVTITIEP